MMLAPTFVTAQAARRVAKDVVPDEAAKASLVMQLRPGPETASPTPATPAQNDKPCVELNYRSPPLRPQFFCPQFLDFVDCTI
jgi:hypothetical protein